MSAPPTFPVSPAGPRWPGGPTVGLLVVAWVAGLLVTVGGTLLSGFSLNGLSASQRVQFLHWQLALGLVLGLGPVALAGLAARGRHRRTRDTFVVLTLLAAGPAVAAIATAWTDLHPRPADPDPPVIGCQERSGGDTRCPGG